MYFSLPSTFHNTAQTNTCDSSPKFLSPNCYRMCMLNSQCTAIKNKKKKQKKKKQPSHVVTPEEVLRSQVVYYMLRMHYYRQVSFGWIAV